MTAELYNCEVTIPYSFPHKLHKVVRNDALLIMHMLSTCCKFKLSAPATHHLFAHDVRPIDLAKLMMNSDLRYALCV